MRVCPRLSMHGFGLFSVPDAADSVTNARSNAAPNASSNSSTHQKRVWQFDKERAGLWPCTIDRMRTCTRYHVAERFKQAVERCIYFAALGKGLDRLDISMDFPLDAEPL